MEWYGNCERLSCSIVVQMEPVASLRLLLAGNIQTVPKMGGINIDQKIETKRGTP